MKNTLRNSLFAVAAVLATGATVYAQDSSNCVAHVPFAYHAGDTTMAAGTYTVTPTGGTNAVVQIRDRDTGDSVMLMAPHNKQATDGASKLVFRRYGDQYFLAQIWTGGGGRVLKTSKLEKEMRASVQNPTDTSLVAVLISPR